MTNWDNLVSGDALKDISEERKQTNIKERVKKDEILSREKNGWSSTGKPYKDASIMMTKKKEIGSSFEDEVWTMFYNMGFTVMNKTDDFVMSYSETNPNLTKQIDVIAIDDEVCLFIECKETEIIDNTTTWKKDLESINGYYGGLCNEIKKKYPNRKCKYIFATKNYILGDQDIGRMNDFRIANFDYDTVLYYKELVHQLGTSAKYQLLGSLFSGQTIKGMKSDVPAIEGKMGGLTYYSFSIEPAKLLKIAYVLHRNNANHDLMPTYQRLIKADRLKKIRKFINDGGYFPNSLIISIDSGGRKLQFDQSSLKVENSVSKIGILHLPKTYQSAYVIDGQHRLYGYSDSKYAYSNSVPVVAFVDMSKQTQVKMFMDINENQKSVSKSLRNTLDIDLLWDSENMSERQKAIMLYIAQKLGEDSKSPLYGRVVTGENTSTTKRCITIEYIKNALEKSCFFNEYKKNKNELIKQGCFEKNTNDETANILYPFISKCLTTISEFCSSEWDKGSLGFLTINNSIYAILRIIDDITKIVLDETKTQIINDWKDFYSKCEDYILSLADTINSLDEESIASIKNAKGGSAKNTSWRVLQVALNKANPQFINDDLANYIKEYNTNYNPSASEKLTLIEKTLRDLVENEFVNTKDWIFTNTPDNIRQRITSLKANQELINRHNGIDEKLSEWDFVSFNEIMEMAGYKSNWSEHFQKILIKKNLNTNKPDVLIWLKDLGQCKNLISNGKRITMTQYEEIEEAIKAFCGDSVTESTKVKL